MTTITMASAIFSTPSNLIRKPTICSLCTTSSSSSPNIRCSTWSPQLGLTSFPQWRWSGLRQLGFPISQQNLRLDRASNCRKKAVVASSIGALVCAFVIFLSEAWNNVAERRSKHRSKVIVASLFGVGAPEALVIGVVALLVFGPKGLAEVARNLGKTLRAFQPTIRELQDVSREFKTTLEKEIGLDDFQNPVQSNYSSTPISRPPPVATPEESQTTVDPNGTPSGPSPNKAYSSEDYLKITEEQLKAAAAASVQQKEQTPPSVPSTEIEPQSQAQDTLQEGSTATPPPVQKPKHES